MEALSLRTGSRNGRWEQLKPPSTPIPTAFMASALPRYTSDVEMSGCADYAVNQGACQIVVLFSVKWSLGLV